MQRRARALPLNCPPPAARRNDGRSPVNRHATAIVIGATGILITGPSGAGKSELAIALLGAARRHALYAALVADDQVLVTFASGRVIASAPGAIAGLIEVRCSGLAQVPDLDSAVMDFALAPVPADKAERLPRDGWLALDDQDHRLPQLFLRWPAPAPFYKLCALCPGLEFGLPARPSRFVDP
nr:hypothetical protein [Marinicella sp. W31]MDC2879348.1 hypothetical protein [Marinicella sp. W31]